MGFLFFIASILSILAFPCNPLIIFNILDPHNNEALRYIGWIFWIVGMTLIILSYVAIFYHKPKGLFDNGVYGVVRHPMYLGGILSIFVATTFLYQHWIFLIIGVPGITSWYLISREEERPNIEKFGDDYKEYMQRVPRMNLPLGIVRLIRQRKKENL